MIESRTEKILNDIIQLYENDTSYEELLVLERTGILVQKKEDGGETIFLETEDGYFSVTVKAEGPFLPEEIADMAI